jgi:hypothetical protein
MGTASRIKPKGGASGDGEAVQLSQPSIRMSHIPLYVGICAAALLRSALNAAPRKVGVSTQSKSNPKNQQT